ncbi:hypothetical protein GVX82_03465 [Patescibacteria group bacterium]|jgi:hypothetical protein|nr:hypothetical protein [Patescibacteria group bacterium]
MDPITKLLGGTQRVRLLRLFFFNPEVTFDRDTAAKRVRSTPAATGKHLTALTRMGLLKKRTISVSAHRRDKRLKKRVPGFVADTRAPHATLLRDFLQATLSVSADELIKALRPHARLRLVVLSGFFVGAWDRRLDLLLVADRVNEEELGKAVGRLEADLGRELAFAVLSPEDYRFRQSIQDRLLRDVFDYEHVTILDRISL